MERKYHFGKECSSDRDTLVFVPLLLFISEIFKAFQRQKTSFKTKVMLKKENKVQPAVEEMR